MQFESKDTLPGHGPIDALNAPKPGGHYSHIYEVGGFVFISGQLPINQAGRPLSEQNIDVQVKACLKNLENLLDGAGMKLTDIVKTTIYVSDVAHWPVVDAIYGAHFGDHRPARSIVPVNKLHFGLDVELEAVAARRGKGRLR